MKRFRWMYFMATLLILTLFLSGCAGQKGNSQGTSANQQNLLNENWQDIASKAKGQTVNIYLWGGSQSTNDYIDKWVAPRLKKRFGIKVNRVPVNDTKDIINKLMSEKQAGKKNGSIDIMWINGENFLEAKNNHLLWKSFSPKLPNVENYVDQNAPAIQNDFGVPTQGLEAPWSQAQFVFIYNSNKVKHPPKSAKALAQWIKEHPGKFTYPAPPDFTGSAFIRNMLYETTGGYKQYLEPFNQQNGLDNKVQPLWNYLNAIKPYLWRKGETYPESVSKLDQLYASGEVWMSMSYDPAHATSEIQNGTFPKSTRTFVLNQGTLSNTSYLSIPFTSPHKAAAMVAINFMLSPDAQIAKANPKIWGTEMAIDPKTLSQAQQNQLDAIPRGLATLPPKVLASHRVPEIPSAYVSYLEKSWIQNVAKH